MLHLISNQYFSKYEICVDGLFSKIQSHMHCYIRELFCYEIKKGGKFIDAYIGRNAIIIIPFLWAMCTHRQHYCIKILHRNSTVCESVNSNPQFYKIPIYLQLVKVRLLDVPYIHMQPMCQILHMMLSG